jgi:hypothetical protein
MSIRQKQGPSPYMGPCPRGTDAFQAIVKPLLRSERPEPSAWRSATRATESDPAPLVVADFHCRGDRDGVADELKRKRAERLAGVEATRVQISTIDQVIALHDPAHAAERSMAAKPGQSLPKRSHAYQAAPLDSRKRLWADIEVGTTHIARLYQPSPHFYQAEPCRRSPGSHP